MSGKYILNGKIPVLEEDVHKWGAWFETAKRHVAKDYSGGVEVSTVFLGLDHQFIEGQPPLLFETMVFGGEHDQDMDRYSTWEEAEKGHKEFVKKFLPPS